MKFCYLDESGTGKEPYAVMVGIIADAYRMHITKKDWMGLLEMLSKILGKQISEIHTADFYAGNGVWRKLDGSIRAKIIGIIFNWFDQRKHEIVYTAVDKTKFKSNFHNELQASEVCTLWRFMAIHICLSLQKHFQRYRENKGNTVVIFDNQKTEAEDFLELIRKPPEWTDTYYQREQKQDRLDQIIDVPYFGDSRHVGLIQLADFVSFFLRKYIETRMSVPPDYVDEPKLIEGWAKIALKQSFPTSAIYLKKGRCDCADLFYRYAPACLLE